MAVAVYNVIWVLAVIPFLVLFGIFMVRRFIKALKETIRIGAVTNSPVLANLGETIAGASTIRAFEKVDDFLEHHFRLQDTNLNAIVMSRAIRSWFNIRLILANQLFLLGSYSYCVSTNLHYFLSKLLKLFEWISEYNNM
jgi:ABC-type bacteriocin/lantibiotic exporter with double-glycine peptidase domain